MRYAVRVYAYLRTDSLYTERGAFISLSAAVVYILCTYSRTSVAHFHIPCVT